MPKQRSRPAKSLRAAPGNRPESRKTIKSRRQQGMTLYSSPRRIMPVEFDTTFTYLVQYVVTTNGALLANIRFTTNAYDVDPTLASTAMAGFSELAALYARFRTLHMSYKFTAYNQEAFPVSILHGFSCVVISSAALGLNYAENPLMSSHMLGPLTGQGRAVYRKSASVQEISGTAQSLYDDLYTGSTTSSTLASAGTCHCYFGVVSNANLTAAGVLVTAEISLRVRLYRPTFIIS
jgi:hypothetical protein